MKVEIFLHTYHPSLFHFWYLRLFSVYLLCQLIEKIRHLLFFHDYKDIFLHVILKMLHKHIIIFNVECDRRKILLIFTYLFDYNSLEYIYIIFCLVTLIETLPIVVCFITHTCRKPIVYVMKLYEYLSAKHQNQVMKVDHKFNYSKTFISREKEIIY